MQRPVLITFGVPLMSGSAVQMAAASEHNQANTLRSLSIETYQRSCLRKTPKEAAKRIEILRREIELANSF